MSLLVGQIALDRLNLPLQDWPSSNASRPFASLVAGIKAVSRISLDRLDIRDVRLINADAPLALVSRLTAQGFARGRMEALTIDRFAINAPAPTSVELATVAVSGFDVNALARVLDKQTYVPRPPERRWNAIAGSIGFASFTRTRPEETLKLGASIITGLQVRTFATDIVEALDAALSPMPAASGAAPLPSDAERYRQLGTELTDILRIDSVAMADLDYRATAGPLRSITCGSLTLTGLGFRALEAAAAMRCALAQPNNVLLGLAELSLRDLSLDRVMAPPVGSEPDLLPRLGEVVLRDGVVSAGGQDARLSMATVGLGAPVRGIPTQINAALDGLTVPNAMIADPGLRDALAGLGIASLKADLAVRAAWRETQDDFEIETVSLGLHDLGRLAISATLSQIPRSTFEKPDTAAATLTQAGVRRVKITYEDSSLAGRILAQVATANKQAPEEMRKVLTRTLPNLLAVIPDATARGKLTFALVGFVNAPSTLEISSAISTPVPLASLLGTARTAPKELPGLLKINAISGKRRVSNGD